MTWTRMEKRAIYEQLRPLVKAWRALEQDTHDPYIGEFRRMQANLTWESTL